MIKQNVTRGSGLLEGFLADKRAEKANSLISEGLRKGKILDIGCGSFPRFLFSTRFKEKFGIDPNITKTNFKGIEIKKNDIERNKLPFEKESFEVVTMLAVFEHINKEKLDFVLSEIKRILKKDGQFIMTTPSPWSDKLLHLMARTGFISKEEIHDHKHNHTHSEIRKALESAGFTNKDLKSGYFEIGFNMWFAVRK